MFWRKRRSEGRAVPTNALDDITRMDAYDHKRSNDTLAAELTRGQFASLARSNGWDEKTIRLLLNAEGVKGRKIAVPKISMGRLKLTVVDQ